MIEVYILKALRKIADKSGNSKSVSPPRDDSPNSVSAAIQQIIKSGEPAMIARFGSTEMLCLANYIGIKKHRKKYLDYIRRKAEPWWWEQSTMSQMQQWSGFFPPTTEKLTQFCELMFQDIPLVDILGSWLPQERYFDKELSDAHKVGLELLNPYFSDIPWSSALEGKKVLVVHPFAATIKMQYEKRRLLFEKNVLPDFDLYTVKAVQSIAGETTAYKDWFEALEFMKAEIDKIDYDICLLGCGAYGFPLAAHVKRKGKVGFHLGGSLQLLFGIRGKRWEDESYNKEYNYARLINEHWVKPNDSERPSNANVVEGACYW